MANVGNPLEPRTCIEHVLVPCIAHVYVLMLRAQLQQDTGEVVVQASPSSSRLLIYLLVVSFLKYAGSGGFVRRSGREVASRRAEQCMFMRIDAMCARVAVGACCDMLVEVACDLH